MCSLADLDPENYIGLDPAQKMLEIAKAKFPGARFVQACCESMPNIETESVDSVTSIFGSFSYVTKPDEAVQEIYRVLKPGGSIFIMAYGPAHKGGSVLPDASIRLLGKLWNSPGLETLFASQFSDAKIVGIGAANRLLDVLGPQQGAQLIDLESQVTDPSYRDECRWLIVTARKTQKNKKV